MKTIKEQVFEQISNTDVPLSKLEVGLKLGIDEKFAVGYVNYSIGKLLKEGQIRKVFAKDTFAYYGLPGKDYGKNSNKESKAIRRETKCEVLKH